MKLRSQIRGPKLFLKLLALSAMLLLVPWLSYQQLVEMERLLVQGQQNSQLLIARSISTLLNDREDLFTDLPVEINEYETLRVHGLRNPVLVDGSSRDWGSEFDQMTRRFGPGSTTGPEGDAMIDLALGEHRGYLYGFISVRDDVQIYRDPGYIRLDNADHARLSFVQSDGEPGRITLTYSQPGVITAYQMDPNWEFAATGVPEYRVRGYVAATDEGYAIEFRLPQSMINVTQGFAASFVDVDSDSREIRSVTQTLPTGDAEYFNLVIFRSPVVMSILEGLGYADTRVIVFDGSEPARVRGRTGSISRAAEPTERSWFDVGQVFEYVRPVLRRLVMDEQWVELGNEESERIADDAIRAALDGKPQAVRRRAITGEQIIMATHPITSDGDVVGAVSVEQNIDEILSFERDALGRVAQVTLLSLLAVVLVIVAFSFRLAYRIGKLRRQTTEAIDEHGRLTTTALDAEVKAGDEIGDLAREIDNMLKRLAQHNQFLERMPRTLRHEINNPLNSILTSLENLQSETDPQRRARYLESANRGVARISSIVQSLSEAASIEDSLKTEDLEVVNIEALLENYVHNCELTHPSDSFVYRGTKQPSYAKVSDYHIEQMMDKIVENAIDFHRKDSPIKVQLDRSRDWLRVTVANRGPILQGNSETLFESMVSQREQQSQRHFGLGLHVVRTIAEYHGGSVNALNLPNRSGVAISVQIPAIAPTEQ